MISCKAVVGREGTVVYLITQFGWQAKERRLWLWCEACWPWSVAAKLRC